MAFCTGNCRTRVAWFTPAQAIGLLLGLALAASQAAGQTPSKEYIHLGGRVIAIENAPPGGGVPPGADGTHGHCGESPGDVELDGEQRGDLV